MENVLKRISPYDIFRMYMPIKDWKLNKATFSPFRDETHPSFVIGNKYGELSFIDFANTEKRGDCFEFVKQITGAVTLRDVLLRIDSDFGLGISSVGENVGKYREITKEYKQPEQVKRTNLIQVNIGKFTTEELTYWAQYHQTIDDLRANNIYNIKACYLNRKLFHLGDGLKFAYYYDGFWKIYRPNADKRDKWMPNNVPITMMDGKENITPGCKVAFINKSRKDYMVVKKVFPCTCAVQNEGIACFSKENVDFLKQNSEKQILSFDSDVAGVKNSQQITKLFNFDYCNVPRKYLAEGIKDWADLAKAHGLEAVEDVLKEKQLI